jgi:hypothetical protein
MTQSDMNTKTAVADLSNASGWPIELVLYLADFLVVHFIFDIRGFGQAGSIEPFQRRILLSCGLSDDEYRRLNSQALTLEKQLGFSSMSTVLEYCIGSSPASVKAACLEYALTCETGQVKRQEKLAEVANRYRLHPIAKKQGAPLQVVYGADFISSKSSSLIFPIILIFDHILSDEGIVFDREEYLSQISDDFKTLKREGILVPYDWPIVSGSTLFKDQLRIREIENEAEEMFLQTAEGEDRDYAPMMASHGYATSLKLSIPSLILPGDQPPRSFLSPTKAGSLPNPDLASNLWIFEALASVTDGFALNEIPVDEMLTIRESVRKGDAHSEFRELALTEVGRLKDDLRGANFSEMLEELKFDIQTNFKPALERLKREIKEIDRKRNRKFLSKIRQEGLSLTLNLLGLVAGPDRPKALLDIARTLYSSADASLSEVKSDIPHGFAFALNLSKALSNDSAQQSDSRIRQP